MSKFRVGQKVKCFQPMWAGGVHQCPTRGETYTVREAIPKEAYGFPGIRLKEITNAPREYHLPAPYGKATLEAYFKDDCFELVHVPVEPSFARMMELAPVQPRRRR